MNFPVYAGVCMEMSLTISLNTQDACAPSYASLQVNRNLSAVSKHALCGRIVVGRMVRSFLGLKYGHLGRWILSAPSFCAPRRSLGWLISQMVDQSSRATRASDCRPQSVDRPGDAIACPWGVEEGAEALNFSPVRVASTSFFAAFTVVSSDVGN